MEEYAMIILRTLVLYFVVLVIFRIMGKREIAELSLLDLVVFILIAEMAAVAIDNVDEPMIKSLVPMFLIVLVQFLLAYLSLKSKRFRLIVDGKPSIIINNGKIDEQEMRRQRYNFDDLMMQLREAGVSDLEDVNFAILETSGKLSVFRKDEHPGIAYSLIIDGDIVEPNLKIIGKDKAWLLQQLKKQGHSDVSNISYCNYNDSNNKLFIDIKDEKERYLDSGR